VAVEPPPTAPAARAATMVDPGDTEAMNEVVEELTPYAGGD
jgi:electron transfer flavoprotein beta subunit